MLKLRLIALLCVFIFALSCHVTADDQDGTTSLLYSDHDIHNFSLATQRDSTLMSGIAIPRVIDYHFKKKFFFWADDDRNINKAPLLPEGAHPSTLRSGVDSYGFAVDWIHDLLYWTDDSNRAVEVARLDGSMVRTIIKEERILPRSIVLNPAEGFMFWADYGDVRKIERCIMDGSNRIVIVKDDILYASSLAIDLESRRVFWVDYSKDYLSAAKFDGNHRKNLITQLKTPYSLDVYGQYVYFSTFQTNHQAVYRASKEDGSGLTKMFDGERNLLGLKIFDSSKQPEGFNVCGDNNGGCSHLCLPTSGRTFSCACPNGRNLSSDSFNCLNPDGSAATTPRLTTTLPSSQLPVEGFEINFSSSTGPAGTTPSMSTASSPSQLPLTVLQSNFPRSTEETTAANTKKPHEDTLTEEKKNNADTTSGSSGTLGILSVVIAAVALFAMVGIMIYNRIFLMKMMANTGTTNSVPKKNAEENMYMEAFS